MATHKPSLINRVCMQEIFVTSQFLTLIYCESVMEVVSNRAFFLCTNPEWSDKCDNHTHKITFHIPPFHQRFYHPYPTRYTCMLYIIFVVWVICKSFLTQSFKLDLFQTIYSIYHLRHSNKNYVLSFFIYSMGCVF